jgi:glyoxylase-like metal-dependent hydrolase (beta-lactamase superfamily II)
MRVHHLNCATMCPRLGRLISGQGPLFAEATMVCHCLLIETSEGLVLVDTGVGVDDVADAGGRLGGLFVNLVRPRLDVAETALRQIEGLGFSARDVRHVVPTHLDLDHAGGLPDFPEARVHIFEPEHSAAMARATAMERTRYRPAHFAHGPRWVRYQADGEPWFGFSSVRRLEGLPPEILLVPLTGHTRGHVAVAVERGPKWLLHAGDAYFHRDEVHGGARRTCPAALDFFQRTAAVDRAAWAANQRRLRALVDERHGEVDIFCAHDPTELERLRAAAHGGAAASLSAA